MSDSSSRDSGVSRRDLFRRSLFAASALGGALVSRNALAAACGLTPRQTEGPFYPVPPQLNQPDKDRDLTFVRDRRGRAKGEIVYIEGLVADAECRPVPGALVEIWQACASGRYNHGADPNPAPLDPDFQYWGRAVTDATGRYAFKTIIPGAYPASATWMRPPHIHYKVAARGYHELITQLYFDGDPLNAGDQILRSLPPADRARVIMKLVPAPQGRGLEPGSRMGRFDIVIRKVGG